ncbi:radical SAM protein [Tissierella creatinini]|nr:radical SAM protein [Tissierella creatinini]TJX66506.1 radical SAM protein [Soehngenia saccharolytica]
MKVLLIRPEPPKETIGLKHVMICEPLELEYLISNVPEYIKNKVNLKIYDLILEKKSYKRILLNEKPDLIVFTAYITHVSVIKSMAEFAKEIQPELVTGVGGVHAEVVPEDFDSPYINFVYNKNCIDAFNETIIGLLVERNIDEIMANIKLLPERKQALIHPSRRSVQKYREKYYYMFHNPCALIKTSYGCPYNCSFCFCKEITDGKYYTRDIEDVLVELKDIEEEDVYIVDDDFLYDGDRINSFIEGLKENEINKKYLVYGRADFIAENQELMKSFKEVGLQAVIVGIESLRADDLKDYRKGTTKEINESCIRILRDLDIELYATLIIPMDFTKSDFKDLRNWLRRQDVRFVNLQPLTPMPGTDIFEEYVSKLIVEREDYGKWDMAHVVLKPENMSIKAFYFQILLSYYRVVMRPKNIKAMIEKYGLEQCFKMFKGSSYVSWQYIKKIVKG